MCIDRWNLCDMGALHTARVATEADGPVMDSMTGQLAQTDQRKFDSDDNRGSECNWHISQRTGVGPTLECIWVGRGAWGVIAFEPSNGEMKRSYLPLIITISKERLLAADSHEKTTTVTEAVSSRIRKTTNTLCLHSLREFLLNMYAPLFSCTATVSFFLSIALDSI